MQEAEKGSAFTTAHLPEAKSHDFKLVRAKRAAVAAPDYIPRCFLFGVAPAMRLPRTRQPRCRQTGIDISDEGAAIGAPTPGTKFSSHCEEQSCSNAYAETKADVWLVRLDHPPLTAGCRVGFMPDEHLSGLAVTGEKPSITVGTVIQLSPRSWTLHVL